MRIDVLLGEGHVATTDVAGRVVVVVDVLRAATTVAVALSNGARSVIPFEQPDEAALRAKQYGRGEVILGGERKMQRMPGFDIGNSPSEYTKEAVDGRTILFSTTNGTAALVATAGCRECFFAALVNVRATVSAVRKATRKGGDVTVVCAGTDKHASLEDIVCAGMLVRGIGRARTNVALGDGAVAAVTVARRYSRDMQLLQNDSSHVRALEDAGFTSDVSLCLSTDSVPTVVRYLDRQLVREQQTRVGK